MLYRRLKLVLSADCHVRLCNVMINWIPGEIKLQEIDSNGTEQRDSLRLDQGI